MLAVRKYALVISLVSGEIITRRLAPVSSAEEVYLGVHKFKDDREFEIVVLGWLLTKEVL